MVVLVLVLVVVVLVCLVLCPDLFQIYKLYNLLKKIQMPNRWF